MATDRGCVERAEGDGRGRRTTGRSATGIERLDKATRRFAELMMDTEVMGAMKGQTMEAAGEGMGERTHRAASVREGGVRRER